jgi:probable HAF family extracellular repeat protein
MASRQIVEEVTGADGTTQYAVWPNKNTITNLGTLPGNFGRLASGINNQGVVVGSTWDSNFTCSRAFIYQNGMVTDLNTLTPANSNLYATTGNKINERGQISTMAIVLSGPHAGKIRFRRSSLAAGTF